MLNCTILMIGLLNTNYHTALVTFKIEEYHRGMENGWTHLDYANVMFAMHPLHQKSSGASRNLLNVDALALRVIKHSDLFGRLTDDQQNQLIKKTEPLNFNIGDSICHEGDEKSSLFILLEGAVQVKKGDVSGDIALNRLGAGEIFGEMSLFTGEKETQQ